MEFYQTIVRDRAMILRGSSEEDNKANLVDINNNSNKEGGLKDLTFMMLKISMKLLGNDNNRLVIIHLKIRMIIKARSSTCLKTKMEIYISVKQIKIQTLDLEANKDFQRKNLENTKSNKKKIIGSSKMNGKEFKWRMKKRSIKPMRSILMI